MTEFIKNIHQRIHAVMQEVTYVQKDKKQGMRYSIVSHDAVTAKLRPALIKNGIVYYPEQIKTEQHGNRTEVIGAIRFVNIDDPQDCIRVESFGYGIDDQDKGPGKAMSYMVKYALLKTFGLETGDDPDLDQEVEYRDQYVEETLASIEAAEEFDVLGSIYQEAKTNGTRLTNMSKAKIKAAYLKRKSELAGD